MRKRILLQIGTIVVRDYSPNDVDAIAAEFCHPTILKNVRGFAGPYKRSDAKRFLRKNVGKSVTRDGGRRLEYAIEIDGKFAGGLGVTLHGHKAEIGYWLGTSWWGKGFMTRIVKGFSSYLIEKYNVRRVFAYVFPLNTASANVLKKCGFHYEGRLRKNHKVQEKYLDDLVFAKVI